MKKKLVILIMALVTICACSNKKHKEEIRSITPLVAEGIFTVLSDTGLGEKFIGELSKTLNLYNKAVLSVSYSPDGKYLASGSDDSIIKIWEVPSGNEVENLRIVRSYDVLSVSYSPDGKYLASGSDNSIIKIWEVPSGNAVETLTGHNDYVLSVSYSPDGKYLASGSDDDTIKIWKVSSGAEVKTLTGHSDGVSSVSYSPDGKYLASGSFDNTIKIWDMSTGKEVKTLTGHSGGVKSVSYSPDGKYLASGSSDKTIKIWEIWQLFKTIKARIKINTNVTNDIGETIGVLPKGIVADISLESKNIYKPLKGSINTNDFEPLYNNNDNASFYTLINTPVYIDIEKKNILTSIEKGKIIYELYYSFDLNMYYIEEGNIKGWISSENIGLLQRKYNKIAIKNHNTNSYSSVDGIIKSTYNSGDIIDTKFEEKGYLVSYETEWFNKNDIVIINESDKYKRIFTNRKEVKFNTDFTGNNYKNVTVGTEYKLLGTTDKYYLVESTSTGEKGWILKSDMSFTKPDLNEPVILIVSTKVDSNNMLTISGKIYDDTAISSLLLNGNKIPTISLNTFDKLSYIPEVGYSFTSQWFLVKGMENNVEIKVTDRDGKTSSKILQYTPDLILKNIK